MLLDDDRAAEIAALKIALEDAALKARTLAGSNIPEFVEVFARAELARQTMHTAMQRHQHKTENRHKMALLDELAALRRL